MADKNIQLRSLNGDKLYPSTKASLVEGLLVNNLAGVGDSKIVQYYIYKNEDDDIEIKRFSIYNEEKENINVYYLSEENQMELYKDSQGNPILGRIVKEITPEFDDEVLVLYVNDSTPQKKYIYDQVNIYHIVDTAKYEIREITPPTTGYDHTFALYRTQTDEEIVGSKININNNGSNTYTRIKSATTYFDTENNILKVSYQLARYKDEDVWVKDEGTITSTLFMVGSGLKIIQSQQNYELRLDIDNIVGKGLKIEDGKLSVNLTDQSIIMDNTGKSGLVPSSTQFTEEQRKLKVLTASGEWVDGITFVNVN